MSERLALHRNFDRLGRRMLAGIDELRRRLASHRGRSPLALPSDADLAKAHGELSRVLRRSLGAPPRETAAALQAWRVRWQPLIRAVERYNCQRAFLDTAELN